MTGEEQTLVVVMGVTGSGKTTTGELLAVRLGLPFADADHAHPPSNIAKMTAGIPLEDADRMPWLRTLAGWLSDHAATGGVLACSALKRQYRDLLRHAAPDLFFVHLAVAPAVLAERIRGRRGHFMTPALIESQLSTLEALEPDERGMTLAGDMPADIIVDAAARAVDPPPAVGR